MKTLSYAVAVLATLLSLLTVWEMASGEVAKPRTEIRVEPQVIWVVAECPADRRCI